MTTPTDKDIPSNSVQDRLFNSEKFDEFINGDNPNYTDRKGKIRWTISGIRTVITNWMESFSSSSGASSVGSTKGFAVEDALVLYPVSTIYNVDITKIAIIDQGLDLGNYVLIYNPVSLKCWFSGYTSGVISSWSESNDGLTVTLSDGSNKTLPDAKTITGFSGKSVDAAWFGVHATTETGFGSYDSTVPLNKAFQFAKANGIKKVVCPSPIYLASEYGRFTLPGDDGSVYPGWVSAGTDAIISPEPVYTMPYCVNIPGGISFSSSEGQAVEITGPWLVGSSDINTNQLIGILQTSNNKYKGTVSSRINIKMTGFMIGRVVEGTLVNGEDSVSYWSCGIGETIQGVERLHYNYVNTNNCIAGIVHGGWWVMRARSQSWQYMPGSFGNYPNNYTYGGVTGGTTDVFPLGWTDFCKMDWFIGEQYRAPYKDRALLIDQFFNTYFYKDGNSALTSAGGRASNTTAGTAAVFPPYRGIAGRMLNVLSRYGRPGSGYQIDFAKTFYQHRTPFYTSEGVSSVGYYISNLVAEGIGCADPNLGLTTGNYFGKDYKDPYRPDNFGIGYMCAQGFYIQGWSGGSNCQRVRISSSDTNIPGSINLNPIYQGQGAGGTDPTLFRISMFDETQNGGYRVPYIIKESGMQFPTGGSGDPEPLFISVGNTAQATVLIGTTTLSGFSTNKIIYRKHGNLIKFRMLLFISGEFAYPSGNIEITGLPKPLGSTEAYYHLTVNQIVSIPGTVFPSARFKDVNTITFYNGNGSTRLDGTVMNTNANGKANYFYIDISGEYVGS